MYIMTRYHLRSNPCLTRVAYETHLYYIVHGKHLNEISYREPCALLGRVSEKSSNTNVWLCLFVYVGKKQVHSTSKCLKKKLDQVMRSGISNYNYTLYPPLVWLWRLTKFRTVNIPQNTLFANITKNLWGSVYVLTDMLLLPCIATKML